MIFDYHCSSESSLGSWHELQHQCPRALPHPFLCPRSDWPSQQWVCGPVHSALQQPEERWAAEAERVTGGRGGWELNYIRWHCVTIIVFLIIHSVSSLLCAGVFMEMIQCICMMLVYLVIIHIFIFIPNFLPHLQATAGCLSCPETDAVWIQPPSSCLSGIPKNSSPYQTLSHTHTPRQQIEKRSWCSNDKNI